MGDVGAVATLLSKVFGFVVDPTGLAEMKLAHRLEVIHAGIKVAIAKKDYDTIDMLFNEYRELSKSVGT